jgi:hypothetical protein
MSLAQLNIRDVTAYPLNKDLVPRSEFKSEGWGNGTYDSGFVRIPDNDC